MGIIDTINWGQTTVSIYVVCPQFLYLAKGRGAGETE
jgi:hypothetical protein